MVTLKGTFDASQYESGFTLVDPGKYVAIVKDSETLERSNGDSGVTLKFEILSEGEFAGATFKENYTILKAQKEEYVIYARQAFAKICNACGKPIIQDTAQIHNIPFGIEIGAGKTWTDSNGNQQESRKIVRSWTLTKQQPANAAPAPVQTPTAQTPAQNQNYVDPRSAFMQAPAPTIPEEKSDVPF